MPRPAHSGDPRRTLLGMTILPAERGRDGTIAAFADAARSADLVAIQRVPPWVDFLPGASVSKQTADTTRLETELLDQYDWLERYYAIDPTDSTILRTRIADLPSTVDPAVGFADPALRRAFISYATYVAKTYRPDYLALGVEVNMLYERSRTQFDAFVGLYLEAYDNVKAASPTTKIFPTFQLEDLLGAFDTVHEPHWEVLDPFRGKMDVLAVSTYPFISPLQPGNPREDYYTQLRMHFEGEILVSSAAYPSAPVETGAVLGTEESQAAFVARLLADAEQAGFGAVTWALPQDFPSAQAGALSLLKDTGLRRSDGSAKLAADEWAKYFARPHRAERR